MILRTVHVVQCFNYIDYVLLIDKTQHHHFQEEEEEEEENSGHIIIEKVFSLFQKILLLPF